MPKTRKISYYRNKCDRLMQMWGKDNYSLCEACGKSMSCLHHFFPKSTSSSLRYDEKNLIPLCMGCHLRHHNGDPTIHANVILKRGGDWYERLKRRKEKITKISKGYYIKIIEEYEND